MKNVNRIFSLFLTALLLLCGSLAFGQDRTLETESDGFRWYELEQDGYYGAQSINGTTLIPLSRKYTFICYHTADGGWFCFRKNNSSTYEGCCDKNGREVIAPERGYNNVYWKDDGYIEVEKNGLVGVCDLNGKEIIAPKYKTLILSDGEFEYKNSQGKWISTGIKYDGETDAYANASSSSSSSSSSSNNSSSSSNGASGNTESKLLYEGDYTESNWVHQYNGLVLNSIYTYQHFEIYEDYLHCDLGRAYYNGKTSNGKRKYESSDPYGSQTYYVDDNFNITAVAEVSGQPYNISYKKGNVYDSYQSPNNNYNSYQSPNAGSSNNGGSPQSDKYVKTVRALKLAYSSYHGSVTSTSYENLDIYQSSDGVYRVKVGSNAPWGFHNNTHSTYLGVNVSGYQYWTSEATVYSVEYYYYFNM